MKKIFFLFTMLASMAASAQSTVQIIPVSATYTNSPTIQFKVSWTNQTTDNHRNKVWIFVDFQTVISPTQKGNWQPATITGTVQKTAGIVSEQSNRGFFLEGTTTNFSSTVTIQLSNTGTQFNWCAYASDYPPNVILDKGTYIFNGTTNFIVSSHVQPVTTKTIVKENLTVNSSSTFTDATGCPGIGCLYCPYTGSDLYMDASHLCQQRASGAQNWEAWIKDTRDNELYRIVLMPDNKWWLAQNIKLEHYNNSTVGTTVNISGCTKEACGRWYSFTEANGNYGGTSGSGANKQGICPDGWILPVANIWNELVLSLDTTPALGAKYLTSTDCTCSRNENYGWQGSKCLHRELYYNWGGTFLTNDSASLIFVVCSSAYIGELVPEHEPYDRHVVRCFRQL